MTAHVNLLGSTNSQRRFCSLIQKYGWDLVNDQIVGPDGSTCGDGGTPATNAPPARKARAKRTPVKKAAAGETPVKKRKLSESIVDSASENEVKQEDQAKDEGEKAEAKEKQTGEAAVDDRSG